MKTINKSLLTDGVALSMCIVASILPQPWAAPLWYAGIFALLGALTNHLAIHMLFHRIPLLYGSGVIERNFEHFKRSIADLIIKEFFSKEHIEAFLQTKKGNIDLSVMIESINFDPVFDALKQSVMESKLSGALQLFGGEAALEGMRKPFTKKLRSALIAIIKNEAFQKQVHHHFLHHAFGENVQATLSNLITQRVEALTPQIVKEMLHRLIARHLGWLVVWGGVIGGVIGVLSYFVGFGQ